MILKLLKPIRLSAAVCCAALVLTGCGRTHNSDDYALDTVVNFGVRGNAEPYRGEGWSPPEAAFTSALWPRARLHMTVRWNNRPLGLRMRVAGTEHPPELPFQVVQIAANDVVVATWQVAKVADFTAVIPTHVLAKRRALYLELRPLNTTSPQSLGLSEDTRPLGLSCFEMQLTKAVAPAEIWPQLAVQ